MSLCVMLALSAALAAAPVPSLDELSWMSGSWGSDVSGTYMEEHWTSPRGGLMVGMHRDVRASGKAFFEFLRIEARPDALVYLASPGGGPATEFRLVESSEKKAVFENLRHDFPQRILYWLDERGRLRARVEGPPGGAERAQEWAWEPLPGLTAAAPEPR